MFFFAMPKLDFFCGAKLGAAILKLLRRISTKPEDLIPVLAIVTVHVPVEADNRLQYRMGPLLY